jgi:hypothetical protein
MVEHLVLFRVEEGREDDFEGALATLVTDIVAVDGVEEASGGRNVSPAGRERGWTHALRVRLGSFDDLDTYRDHGIHERFLGAIRTACPERFAVDYEPMSGAS